MEDMYKKIEAAVESLASGPGVCGWSLTCEPYSVILEVRTIELSSDDGVIDKTKTLRLDAKRFKGSKVVSGRGLCLGGLKVVSFTIHNNVNDVWRCDIHGLGLPDSTEDVESFFGYVISLLVDERDNFVEVDNGLQAD